MVGKRKQSNAEYYIILQKLNEDRRREVYSQQGGVASLHNERVDCLGFMKANPNDRIAFAAESGLFNAGNDPADKIILF
jgi:hypothetical protein